MKKILLLSTAFVCISVFAQPAKADKKLTKTLSLKMPLTEADDMPGKRGSSVVWHPLQKKYYAAMAGNMGYPLAIFDAAGKRISNDSSLCRQDVRGLWYNPETKEIQGNCYSDYGWFSYKLNPKGIVTASEIFMKGMNQPDAQTVGAYSAARKSVLFLNAGYVSIYSLEDGISDESVKIHWGIKKADADEEDEEDEPETPEDYNYTTVVFTGIKGAELGFLNVTDKQIELYDFTEGYLSKVLKLPDDASLNESFNFAYSNGTYWLFNMDTRIWTGYK